MTDLHEWEQRPDESHEQWYDRTHDRDQLAFARGCLYVVKMYTLFFGVVGVAAFLTGKLMGWW